MGNNGGESKGDTEQFQGTGPNTRERAYTGCGWVKVLTCDVQLLPVSVRVTAGSAS